MSHEQEQTTQPSLLTPVEVAAKKLREALEADTRFFLWSEYISDSSPVICTVFIVRCYGSEWKIKATYLDEDRIEEVGYELSSPKDDEPSTWLKSDRSPNGYEMMLDEIVRMSNKAAASQEQTTIATPISHAMLMGNGLRRLVIESMGNRRTAIAYTAHDKPGYQATLNCMEADLLTALATVIQDYIERMTNDLELERQRKQMDGKFSEITRDIS